MTKSATTGTRRELSDSPEVSDSQFLISGCRSLIPPYGGVGNEGERQQTYPLRMRANDENEELKGE